MPRHGLVLSDRHLRRVLREYVASYYATRPYQPLEGERRSANCPPGPVRLGTRPILGGLHHEYAREVA